MNRLREIIEKSLNSIRNRLLQNLVNNEQFWVGLEGQILLLQQIAQEVLENDDELLNEIENTRQVIQRRNIAIEVIEDDED
jgi:hypothetical protein